MTTLDVVVGGLYGSEAKGHCTQRLTEKRLAEFGRVEVIRVAGPNAGHTGHDQSGKAWALRQLPVAVVVPGNVTLGIADGSEIDPPVLLAELADAKQAGLMDDKTLWVSGEATIIDDEHKESDSSLVKSIGSTGKGIGSARAGRLMRKASRLCDRPELVAELEGLGAHVQTGPRRFTGFDPVIIEGTQGYALGLHAGFYPQCTSSDCRAIDFLSMAGVSPWLWNRSKFRVWVVARMFPIRVAGNSGPMQFETTWDELGLDPEFTTVTKKQRRVGAPDWELVHSAVVANGGGGVHGGQVRLALFMADQMWPELSGSTSHADLTDDHLAYLDEVGMTTTAPVAIVGTGPDSVIWMEESK